MNAADRAHPVGRDISRRLATEAVGTAFLLMAIVGSGIMAERLAGGNAAIALLANTLATGAVLVVLIAIFAPLSGAHFNPAVTLFFALRREIPPRVAISYIGVQVVAAVAGVYAAHAMFGNAIFEVSHRLREGPAQAFSEFVAAFGLIVTIAGSIRACPECTAVLVGLYIAAAYWFTASTSFANPAVTIARSLTDSFAGIAPRSAPAFIAAELGGMLAAWWACAWLFAARPRGSAPTSAIDERAGA